MVIMTDSMPMTVDPGSDLEFHAFLVLQRHIFHAQRYGLRFLIRNTLASKHRGIKILALSALSSESLTSTGMKRQSVMVLSCSMNHSFSDFGSLDSLDE